MITIDGNPVLFDHEGQVERFVRYRYPSSDSVFDSDRKIAGRQFEYWPQLPDCLLSEVQYPVVGATRYTRTLQLVDWDSLANLMLTCWGVTWNGEGQFPKGSADDPAFLEINQEGTSDYQRYKLYLHEVIRLDGLYGFIDPAAPPTPPPPVENRPELFVVAMVDYRHRLARKSIDATTIDVRQNWEYYLNMLRTETGLTINTTVDFDPKLGHPDPGTLAGQAKNPAEAIDQLCYSTGLRPVYDKENGSFTLQQASEAKTIFDDIYGDPEATPDPIPPSVDPIIRGGDRPDVILPLTKKFRCQWAADHWLYPKADRAIEVELDSTSVSENAKSDADDVVDCTWIVEWFDGAIDQGADQAVKDLIEFLAIEEAAWAELRYETTSPAPSFKTHSELEKFGATDFLSTRFYNSGPIPEAVLRAETFANGFYPDKNFCQKPYIYIHATDVAAFIATSDTQARILFTSDHDYNGTPQSLTVTGTFVNGDRFPAYFNWYRGWTRIEVPSGGGGDFDLEIVRFRMTERIVGSNQGKAVVINPLQSGYSFNAEILLEDDTGIWRDMLVGAEGLAVETKKQDLTADPPIAGVFEIINGARQQQRIQLVADEDFSEIYDQIDVTWSSNPWYFEPYIDDPETESQGPSGPVPIRIGNARGLYGPKNGRIICERVTFLRTPTHEQRWEAVYSLDRFPRKIVGQVIAFTQDDPRVIDVAYPPSEYWDGALPSAAQWDDLFPVNVPSFYGSEWDNIRPGEQILFEYNSVQANYRIVSTVSRFAKFIYGEIDVPASGGGVGPFTFISGFGYFEGEDPPNPECWFLFKPPTACGQMFVIARWSPEDNRYYIITTHSALMGKPTTKQIPVPGAPATTVITCDDDDKTCIETTRTMQEIVVFEACTDPMAPPVDPPTSTESLCFDSQSMINCLFGGDVDDDDAFCEYICINCEQFAQPDGGCGCGQCHYTFTNGAWELDADGDKCDSPCRCQDPPVTGSENEGDQISTDCLKPPCGVCKYTYSSGGWQLDTDGDECASPCECDPPPVTGSENEGDQITTWCVDPGGGDPCDSVGGECAQCGTDHIFTVTQATAGAQAFEVWTWDSATDALIRVGPCSVKLFAQWDDGTPTEVTATLNGDGSVSFESSVSGPQSGYSGSFDTPAGIGCIGSASCTDSGGNCRDNDFGNASWQAAPCTGLTASELRTVAAGQLGQAFASQFPEYFEGCGCKRDVIAVMNRWKAGGVTDKQINTVVRTMKSKSPSLDADKLTKQIREFFDD